MTQEEVYSFAKNITYVNQATVVTFNDNTEWVGYFENEVPNQADNQKNMWSFVKFIENDKFHIFNGDDVKGITIRDRH
jgi:hypothetical protein